MSWEEQIEIYIDLASMLAWQEVVMPDSQTNSSFQIFSINWSTSKTRLNDLFTNDSVPNLT